MSTKKVTILTGAPLSSSLRWDEEELSQSVLPCFRGGRPTSPDTSSVRWRVLKPPTAFSHVAREDEAFFAEETSFFAATDPLLSTSRAADGGPSFEASEDLSQFYDHSFAIHEDVPSSQISMSFGTESLEDSYWNNSTTESMERGIDGRHQSPEPCLPSFLGHLSDLVEIPNAAYLRSINPQTMTVNLIVTVISIYPRRRIKTRQWGREMDIVEMVTADETKSGFGITFWLQPTEQDSKPADGLEESLSHIRPRDIILLRTVALSSFRDKVHGQSLRRDLTKIDLLHRRPLDSSDQGGICSTNAINAAYHSDQYMLKIQRVRDWIMDFVGSNTYENAEEGTHPVGRMGKPLLPPDTQ
ncbi:hypothetical protein FQN54_005785 [Arachnomyces sp. PD_36]|nr:hypothetical protein FQN54_005785 [Arachnomyces sp. PD_36]